MTTVAHDLTKSAALAQLIRANINLVHSTALAQLRDPHLADDATQAVFLLLIRKAPTLPAGTVIPGWLFKTTCYVAAEIRRQNARRQRRQRESAMPTSLDSSGTDATKSGAPREAAPPDAAMAQEQRAALHAAIARLPADDRSAIVLHYFQGQTSAEIAAALRTSDTATRIRLSRARERLRGFLRRTGITLTAAAIVATLETSRAHAAPAAALAHCQSLIGGTTPAHIRALAQGVQMAIRAKQVATVAVFVAIVFTVGLVVMTMGRTNPAAEPAPGAAATAAATGPEGLTILSVDVAGNVRTQTGTIIAAMEERKGQVFSRALLGQDTKSVAALGGFATVRGEFMVVEDDQGTPPRRARGVNIRMVVAESAAASSAPKSVVLAAYHDALGGDEAAFLACFGSLSDDGKPLSLPEHSVEILRALVRGMHAFDALTAAVGEKFGPEMQKQIAQQNPSDLDPAEIENATVREIDADHAIVDMGSAGPGKVQVVRINGAWLVDAGVLATLNESSVKSVDDHVDQINALAAAVKAGKFPDAASFMQAVGPMLKP